MRLRLGRRQSVLLKHCNNCESKVNNKAPFAALKLIYHIWCCRSLELYFLMIFSFRVFPDITHMLRIQRSKTLVPPISVPTNECRSNCFSTFLYNCYHLITVKFLLSCWTVQSTCIGINSVAPLQIQVRNNKGKKNMLGMQTFVLPLLKDVLKLPYIFSRITSGCLNKDYTLLRNKWLNIPYRI